LKAARKLGIAEIPVFPCDEWTPAQVKAFRLMVNRSVTWADWNEEALAQNCREVPLYRPMLGVRGSRPQTKSSILLSFETDFAGG